MAEEKAAGGIVVHRGRVLMIHDRYGHWTFPKGHVEEGETEEDAARREVAEETGVPVRILRSLGHTRYTVHRPEGPRPKTVAWYLMAPEGEGDTLRPLREEISTAEWVALGEVEDRLVRQGYENQRDLWRAAQTALKEG